MQDLSSTQRDLLFVLSGLDEPTGVELKRELEQAIDREVSSGKLYANLNDLDEKGLIRKVDEGRSNHYAISDRGRREVQAHRSWQREVIQVEGESR